MGAGEHEELEKKKKWQPENGLLSLSCIDAKPIRTGLSYAAWFASPCAQAYNVYFSRFALLLKPAWPWCTIRLEGGIDFVQTEVYYHAAAAKQIATCINPSFLAGTFPGTGTKF